MFEAPYNKAYYHRLQLYRKSRDGPFRGFILRFLFYVYFRFRIIVAGMEVIRMAIGYFCEGTILA